MRVHFLVHGETETIEMLGRMLAPGQLTPLVQENDGWRLAMEVDVAENRQVVATKFQQFLDLANGVMRLWAFGRDRLKLKGLTYQDPESGKRGGLLINAYSIVEPLAPERLFEPTLGGRPRGEATLNLARHNSGVARALSILASGGSEWWQLYILLEILRDSIGQRPERRTGSWELMFQALRGTRGESVSRLKDLKRTINYHRHASSAPPAKPWGHPEAVTFVHSAIREWLQGLLEGEVP